MRRRIAVAVLLLFLLAAAGWMLLRSHGDRGNASHPPPRSAAKTDLPPSGDELSPELAAPMFDVMPLHLAVREVGRRFQGRVIAVMLVTPTPHERRLGVDLVYAVRLLTPGRDVVDLRIDARSGALVDIRGNDIAAARKIP